MEGGAALGVEGGGAGEAGPGEGEVLGTHPGPEAGPAGSSGRLPLLLLMLLGDRHPRLLPSKLECHSLACLEPWAKGRELRAGPGGSRPLWAGQAAEPPQPRHGITGTSQCEHNGQRCLPGPSLTRSLTYTAPGNRCLQARAGLSRQGLGRPGLLSPRQGAC